MNGVPRVVSFTDRLGDTAELYMLPFDHRSSFEHRLFGGSGARSDEQAAQIAATKQVVYERLLAAIDRGVPRANAARRLDAGASAARPNDKGSRPLQVAARYQLHELVERLPARGADVAARSTHGRTALHDAIW
jgi:ankyrin repeat protein